MRQRPETHLSYRTGWLRAAVLGANDGMVSVSALVLGVAAAGGSTRSIVIAGVSGLVAGALSMATGEFVSVSAQRDTETADLHLEERELAKDPGGELDELTEIYEDKGLSRGLARQVAVELSRGDPLAAHARDELGIEDTNRARPLQAAWASACSFTAGALLPLLAISLTPHGARVAVCVAVTLVALGLLGTLGAVLGGAPRLRAAGRVLIWGAIAMAVTSGIGLLTGSVA